MPNARVMLANSAAHDLRVAIDEMHERISDLQDGATADEQTKDLYDAVTLLHEFACEER